MFTFTPLLGAQTSSSRASQSILELDEGIKILVDVGWDDTFDTRDLAELEKLVSIDHPLLFDTNRNIA
jgi:cleavage and polyadenylation specificity factor subunit 2